MNDQKPTIGSKLKNHFSENKDVYVKFGYYTLGVLAMTATYTVMEKYQLKQRNAMWDKVELEQRAEFGADVVTLRNREGYFFYFKPETPEI